MNPPASTPAAAPAAAQPARRFDVLTLFPELITPFTQSGITRRAWDSGHMQLKLWNPRDFAQGQYRRVDDRPFGGGPGMVMLAEPLAQCLQAAQADRAACGFGPAGADDAAGEGKSDGENASENACPVILFSPIGPPLTHTRVADMAASRGAILICGRYEGIDQRFIDRHVTHQISLGDFILSGGEIAAVALLDAIARLQPGVLGDEGSHQLDSFNPALDGLLDCPHYTRPEHWQGQPVPEALLSGHHARISRWRRDQSLHLTARLRPDLITAARQAGRLSREDEATLAQKTLQKK